MLRLHRGRLPVEQRNGGGYCVLVFPDSTEIRWLDKRPTPGTRIRSREGWGYSGQVGETWVVDEVVQDDREGDTCTIYCVGRSRYLHKLRNSQGFQAGSRCRTPRTRAPCA